MAWLKWLGGAVALVVAFFAFAPGETPQRAEARKRACTEAMMSSIGRGTTGYADKVAYDKVVRDKCAGFEINGKAIAP